MLFQKISIQAAFLFFIFLSDIPSIYAQYQYCEFPTEDAVWMSRNAWHIAQGILIVNDLELRLTAEDTILSGKTYKKIYQRLRVLYADDTGPLPPLDDITSDQPDKFYMGIREENKKVYLRYFYSEEELWYDFNMSIGDTITKSNHTGFVSNIDTIELGAKLRRRFEVTVLYPPSVPTNTFYIIEGIGSILSLHPDAPNPPLHSELICMKISDEVIYQAVDYSFCPSINERLISSNDNPFSTEHVSIHPNPANEFIYFELIENRAITDLEIFDLTGKQIYSADSVMNKEKIDVTSWPNGILFVSYKNGNQKYTSKLIKN